MVSPEHDDGVVGILALGQRFKDHAEAVIDVADIGEIGLLRLKMQVGLVGGFKTRIWTKKLLAFVVDDIVQVVAYDVDGFQFIERIEIKKLLWNLPGQMGFGDSEGKEKRLAFKITLELIGCPFAGNIIFGFF